MNDDLTQTVKAQEILHSTIATEELALRYLTDRGWKRNLSERVMLKPTHGRPITDEEWFILQYLIDHFYFKGMRTQ